MGGGWYFFEVSSSDVLGGRRSRRPGSFHPIRIIGVGISGTHLMIEFLPFRRKSFDQPLFLIGLLSIVELDDMRKI